MFLTRFAIASCRSSTFAIALYSGVRCGAGSGGAVFSAGAGSVAGGEIPCNAFIKFKRANFSVILSSINQIFVKIASKFIA